MQPAPPAPPQRPELQSDWEELKFGGLVQLLDAGVASIGLGGIEMLNCSGFKSRGALLQSDWEELK